MMPPVVQYLISSPNHNGWRGMRTEVSLFSILFHHQTTTVSPAPFRREGCLVSYFITKPQLPTSKGHRRQGCLVSYFITKPQPIEKKGKFYTGCLVSYFITKPQQNRPPMEATEVVQYLISSPNHNSFGWRQRHKKVVQYLISSPNHNSCWRGARVRRVVQYLISSPNHNSDSLIMSPSSLFSILFHHQTTTRTI